MSNENETGTTRFRKKPAGGEARQWFQPGDDRHIPIDGVMVGCLELKPDKKNEVVGYVVRGEDILFAGLLERATNATFFTEYPDALWSHQIQTPTHVMTD